MTEVLTVAELLKRDGAKDGDVYSDGKRSWVVRGENLFSQGVHSSFYCDAAEVAHIPGLRRVRPKQLYIMKVRLHGVPEEIWGTKEWAQNMQGDPDVEYCVLVPGKEMLVEA